MPNLQAWIETQIRDHSPRPGRPESRARAVLDACVALSGRGGVAFGAFPPASGYPEAQRLYQLCCQCLGDWLPSIQDQELLDELIREIARHDLGVVLPPALAAKTMSRRAESDSLDEVRRRTDTDHPILGRLTWNEPWLVASVASRSGQVGLVMEVTHQDDVDTLLNNAVRIFKSLDRLTDHAITFAAPHLLETINAGYRADGEAPVTKEEFTRRVTPLLRAVSIDAEGDGFQFSFDDDNLLWGHEIDVQFDADECPIDASFAG